MTDEKEDRRVFHVDVGDLSYEKVNRLLDTIRNLTPEHIAKELNSVQPMPSNAISELYKMSASKEELEAEDYKPVSGLGLMWVK